MSDEANDAAAVAEAPGAEWWKLDEPAAPQAQAVAIHVMTDEQLRELASVIREELVRRRDSSVMHGDAHDDFAHGDAPHSHPSPHADSHSDWSGGSAWCDVSQSALAPPPYLQPVLRRATPRVARAVRKLVGW